MPPKDWSPHTIAKDKLEDVVHDALQDFWAKVAREFPTVKSGDLDPMTVVMFSEHAFDVVLQWLVNNHPVEKVRDSMETLLEKRESR